MLANGTLKQTLISYIMTQFIKFGSDDPTTVQLILDYQDLDCPCSIYMGWKSDLTMLKNKNGEADYNLWFHCMASTSSKLVLLGSDTDIWVYGMALMECGWLGDKSIYVERALNSEYVNVNAILEESPKLEKSVISYPNIG